MCAVSTRRGGSQSEELPCVWESVSLRSEVYQVSHNQSPGIKQSGIIHVRVDMSSATSLVPKRKREKVNFGELRFTRNWVEADPSGVHPPCLSATAREYINSILLIR